MRRGFLQERAAENTQEEDIDTGGPNTINWTRAHIWLKTDTHIFRQVIRSEAITNSQACSGKWLVVMVSSAQTSEKLFHKLSFF